MGRQHILGLILIAVVTAVVFYTHQYIIPLFLGLLAWAKPLFILLIAWVKLGLKKATPKLGLLLLKNSVFVQLRRFALKISTHLFVKSHKPWRRYLTRIRLAIVAMLSGTYRRYIALPLWLRTGIAIALLLATAGSSFVVFALLIIPQALLEWLKARLVALLSKLGITRLLAWLWNLLVPAGLRHRWYMYLKWTLGRQQLRAARRVHQTVVKESPQGAVEEPAQASET